MNPIEIAGSLNSWLAKRIRSTFPIDRAAPQLSPALDTFFENTNFLKDPCLEITPPYESGSSLQKLVDDGVILQRTADVFAKVLAGSTHPKKVTLYRHQDEAIRKVCASQSLVVSTGTGSGKTECFLIPIIDYLLRRSEADELTDDVHVMILYPMNALVNDQLARLREILTDLPEIRFGKYTGELASISNEESVYLAPELIKDLNHSSSEDVSLELGFDRNLALKNEVTRRSQWRSEPAHILVTNFSMLEYLLLRPEDSSLFGDKWRFIVLDEAHCYNGAMGTEIAWLMRRLVNRVSEAGSSREQMQYIATSATLVPEDGSGPLEKATFVREQFASKIFPVKPTRVHYQEGYPSSYKVPTDSVDWNHEIDIFKLINETEVPQEWISKYEGILQLGNDRTLYSWTKSAVDELNWIERQLVLKSFYVSLQQGSALGVSDLLFLLRNLEAVCSVLNIRGDISVTGKKIFKLLRQVAECLASFAETNVWVDILNDPLAPQHFKKPPDGKTYRIGNRVQYIAEWNDECDVLQLDSFDYLLKAALHAASNSEQLDLFNIGNLTVKVSDETCTLISSYIEQLNERHNRVLSLNNDMQSLWSSLIPALENTSSPLSSIVSSAIAGHPDTVNLNATLLESLSNAKQDRESLSLFNLSKKVESIFTGDANNLVQIFDWCCFAKPTGSRHPIIDLRYHQLAQGLAGLGINISSAEDISFVQYQQIGEPNTYSAGVCRDCGQPYILGFLTKRSPSEYPANNQPNLSPLKSSDHKYMVALYWEKYDIDGDDVIDEKKQRDIEQGSLSYYLNTETGDLYEEGEPNIPANVLSVRLLQPSPSNETFISGCARCGGSHRRPQENEFGIVTPVAFESTAAKVTLLDELARLVDPSDDPVARMNAGEGRKVLTFSDSRSGAARFAYQFHVDYLITNGKRFLNEGIKSALAQPKEERAVNLIPEEDSKRFLDNELVWKALITDALSRVDDDAVNLSELCVAFKKCIEKYNLPDSFCVLGEDGSELSQNEAIRFQVCMLICDKSRNSLMKQGLASIQFKYENPEKLIKQTRLSTDSCRSLIDEIIQHWILRKKTTRGENWPEREQSFGGVDPYVITKEQFATGPAGKLNKLVQQKCQCDGADAREILISIWTLLLEQKLLVVGNNNQGYQFDINKIYLSRGREQFELELSRADEYFQEKYSRKIIPIRVEEHTAQLSKERGVNYQEGFVRGRVNVLSCSTTFEMGIDVGDLSAVFLTNLPPNVASYRQRAGRAGRRAGASAYVLTFVTSNPYDQYYWNNPEKLYLGEVQAPKIYMSNPMIRARHLRAEAFHAFLVWLGKRLDGGKRITDHHALDADNNIRPYNRKWQKSGDMFGGLQYRWINRKPVCGRKFTPLVELLSEWQAIDAESSSLSKSVGGILCEDSIDYDVAHDLTFQCFGEHAPYDLVKDNKKLFDELGGPNNYTGKESAKSLFREHIVRAGDDIFISGRENSASAYQRSRFSRKTIEVLSRHSVLPKYGFPVDVIDMIPDPGDIYGKNVDMSRDLRVGLFEYAPQQSVIADKRLYESSNKLGIRSSETEATCQPMTRCEYCGHISPGNNDTCELCRSIDCSPFDVVQPDYFVANKSVADMSRTLQMSRGVRQYAFTPVKGETGQHSVPGQLLKTAVPVEPAMYLFNRGLHYQGFSNLRATDGFTQLSGTNGQGISLMHSFRTDITYWQPFDQFFDRARLFSIGYPPDDPDADRRRITAMQGALNAVLRVIPHDLGIAPNEVDGLLYPIQALGTAFVLFDNVSGGAGHVQRLRLDSNTDHDSAALISKVFKTALSLFDQCSCANVENGDLYPVSSADYRASQQHDAIRERKACFHCLWKPNATEQNRLLDAHDTAVVLRFLINEQK